MIQFLKDSSSKNEPKKAKAVKKHEASKRKIAPNSSVTIAGSYSRRIGSPPTSIDIPSNIVVDESSLDFLEPTRPINNDIYTLVRRSW